MSAAKSLMDAKELRSSFLTRTLVFFVSSMISSGEEIFAITMLKIKGFVIVVDNLFLVGVLQAHQY